MDAKTIGPATFDLIVNPNGGEEFAHRSPAAIMEELAALDAECSQVLGNIKPYYEYRWEECEECDGWET